MMFLSVERHNNMHVCLCGVVGSLEGFIRSFWGHYTAMCMLCSVLSCPCDTLTSLVHVRCCIGACLHGLCVMRAWHTYFFAFRALFGKGQGAINVKAEEGRHLSLASSAK